MPGWLPSPILTVNHLERQIKKMAGFGKVTFVGEYFNQSVVNIFHYRSTEWLPGQGNPFDDVLAFVVAVTNYISSQFLACLPTDYTLLRSEGVGYDNNFNIVTASPLVHSLSAAGTLGARDTNGAANAANIGLRCGEQVQINGIGTSKRNRGYLCLGPVGDADIDNYGHVSSSLRTRMDTLAQKLDDGITVVAPAVTLTPIRVHAKFQRLPNPLPDVLLWRTYSDIKGYTLPRQATYRRSRRAEA